MEYPWYREIEDKSLEQGDIIPNCPFIHPPNNFSTAEELNLLVSEMNGIVMSQSCDLVAKKITLVTVCPVFSRMEYVDNLPLKEYPTEKSKRAKLENMKRGRIDGLHLLDKDESFNLTKDFLIIDFRQAFAVHIDFLIESIERMPFHIRLLPPYREHMSQAFARFYMRVGLPQDIDLD